MSAAIVTKDVIVSVDVGIRNLSVCVVAVEENNIVDVLEWCIVDLTGDSDQSVSNDQHVNNNVIQPRKQCEHCIVRNNSEHAAVGKKRGRTPSSVRTCGKVAHFMIGDKIQSTQPLDVKYKYLCATHVDTALQATICDSSLTALHELHWKNTLATWLNHQTKPALLEIVQHLLPHVKLLCSCDDNYEHKTKAILAKQILEWMPLMPVSLSHRKKWQQQQTKQLAKKSKTNATELPLDVKAFQLWNRFDRLFFLDGTTNIRFPNLKTVVVENQMGPTAVRMVAVQALVFMYCSMRFPQTVSIQAVSSVHKLAFITQYFQPVAADATAAAPLDNVEVEEEVEVEVEVEEEVEEEEAVAVQDSKTNDEDVAQTNKRRRQEYNNRKQVSVWATKALLLETLKTPPVKSLFPFAINVSACWVDFFSKVHKKRDDLADSFLQVVWYVYNKQAATTVTETAIAV